MSNEFKMVPLRPTAEMIAAMQKPLSPADGGYVFDTAQKELVEAVIACIAAAPQPPALGGEPVVLPTDWRSLADQLQEVGLAYWKAHDRERDRGAVKFLHNEETGALFVVTRGEYADQLKDFIFSLDCPAQPATANVVLPEGDDIPDFSPGNGNKARRRAEALKKARGNTDYDEFDNGVD